MSKFKDPVHPEKIKLIQNLLNDPIVKECWDRYVNLGVLNASFVQREKAFQEYCHFRDLYLGLPPVKLEGIQGTNKERKYF